MRKRPKKRGKWKHRKQFNCEQLRSTKIKEIYQQVIAQEKKNWNKEPPDNRGEMGKYENNH